MIWTFSHGDTPYKYYYSFIGKIKVWKRVRITPQPCVFSCNPNGIIWFSNEQQFLKFIQ